MPIDAMFMDDPPDVNCRAVYATRRRTISLIPITRIDPHPEGLEGEKRANRKWISGLHREQHYTGKPE